MAKSNAEEVDVSRKKNKLMEKKSCRNGAYVSIGFVEKRYVD